MKKTTILNSLNTLICCCILLLISACSSGMSDCGVPEFDVDDSVNTTVESARDTIAVPAGAKEKKAVGAMKQNSAGIFRNKPVSESSPFSGVVKKIDGRKIIYTVNLSMNVPDIAEAIENTRKLLESKGGYVVSMNNSFLEVRVPVDHFDAFCKELQGVGTIVNHFMSSSDVTQQMTDTESRIAALELLKKRLHEIAQKAVTVEDMLQVERELNRVIGELEELKKNMKNFTLQTDYCLVRINFAAQIQAPAPIKQIPVAWMNQYGVNLLSDGWIRTGGDHYKPYKIDLPQNFMITGSRLKNDSSFLTAVSPDGSVIRLSSHANMKGGTLDYYAELAKRYFTDYQNLKIQSFELERIGEKRQAFVMNAERKEAGKQTLYYYWVCFMDKDRLLSFDEGKVYCFEYQCDDPEVWNKTLPEIKQCLQTLNLSVWR